MNYDRGQQIDRVDQDTKFRAMERQHQVLILALEANVPFVLKGVPGGGKTAAQESSIGLLEWQTYFGFYTGHLAPTDLNLPYLSDNHTGNGGEKEVKYAPPFFAHRFEKGKPGILHVDEISDAPRALQSPLLSLVHTGRIGFYEMDPNVRRVASMNPLAVGGNFNLKPSLANRFCHILWEPDLEYAVKGIRTGEWPLLAKLPDPKWETNIPKWREIVATYLQSMGKLHHLLLCPEDEELAAGPWASPRMWNEYVIPLMAVVDGIKGKVDSELFTFVQNDLCAGCVGIDEARDFFTWLSNLALPDPLEVLSNPKNFKLLERMDQNYVHLGAIVSTALRDPERHWKAAWTILKAAAEEGATDMAAVHAKDLARCIRDNPDLELPTGLTDDFLPVLKAAGYL